jgi:hypothetical protein
MIAQPPRHPAPPQAMELPQMAEASHSHTIYSGADFGTAIGGVNAVMSAPHSHTVAEHIAWNEMIDHRANALRAHRRHSVFQQIASPEQGEITMPAAPNQRRYVRIIVVDPDPNVPLDQCLLHSGAEKLTDLTDQELFYDLDMRTMLEEHNSKRVKLQDKTVKERTQMLEPARIRDLKMTVVTIAQF